jgi:hypothetical protein
MSRLQARCNAIAAGVGVAAVAAALVPGVDSFVAIVLAVVAAVIVLLGWILEQDRRGDAQAADEAWTAPAARTVEAPPPMRARWGLLAAASAVVVIALLGAVVVLDDDGPAGLETTDEVGSDTTSSTSSPVSPAFQNTTTTTEPTTTSSSTTTSSTTTTTVKPTTTTRPPTTTTTVPNDAPHIEVVNATESLIHQVPPSQIVNCGGAPTTTQIRALVDDDGSRNDLTVRFAYRLSTSGAVSGTVTMSRSGPWFVGQLGPFNRGAVPNSGGVLEVTVTAVDQQGAAAAPESISVTLDEC